MKTLINKIKAFKNLNIQILFSLIIRSIGAILGYAITYLLVKNYGAEVLGIINLSLSSLNFLGVLAGFGLSISILRFAGQFNQKGKRHNFKKMIFLSLKIVLPLSIILSVIIISVHLLSIFSYDNQLYNIVIPLIAISIPFYALYLIFVEFLRGLQKIFLSEILRNFLRPLINILLLLYIFSISNFQENLPIVFFFVSILIVSIFSAFYVFKIIFKIKSSSEYDLVPEEFNKTSISLWVTSILSFFEIFYILFIIELFDSSQNLGVYSLSIRLALITSFVVQALYTVIAPQISKLYWSSQISKLQNFIKYVFRLNIAVCLLPFLIILMFPKEILHFFDEKISSQYIILIILSISQFINCLFGPLGIILNMTGNEKNTQYIITITSIFILFSAPLVIMNYGIYGAALLQLFSSTINRLLSYYYVRKNTGLKMI